MRIPWFIVFLVVNVFGTFVKERISFHKCREYCESINKPCIVGDESENGLAISKEFPHMATIGYGAQDNIEWECNGILISDQYIVSAAHCISNPVQGQAKWVRLGQIDLSSSTNNTETQDFNITEIISHPDYIRPSLYNDIVLFKLDRPIEFTEYVRPACLPTDQQEVDGVETFTLTGWGEEVGVPHKSLKQDKNIQKISNEECNKEYEDRLKRRLEDGVKSDIQLCIRTPQSSACYVKSGAPIQYNNKHFECMYNIAGFLSTGLEFCGPIPEIYTNIPGYLDWIESVVWPIV